MALTAGSNGYPVPGFGQRQKQVPLLSFPHAVQLSPHYAAVRPRVHEWFISKGVLPQRLLAPFLGQDHTLLAAMMHAESSPDRLENIARYYTLWFAMEERDEALWARRGGVRRFYADILEYLDTGRVRAEDPWLYAFAETVDGMGFTPDLGARYRRWEKDWIEAEIRVADYGNTPHVDFLEDRHHAVGMMLGLTVFTQYSLSLDLPRSVMEDPAMEELLWALVRISSWQSDLLTLEYETARRENVNVVNVLVAHRGMTRDEAVAEVYSWYCRGLADAYRKLATVLASSWEAPPLVMDGYCNGLLATTAAFLAWNQITDRYSVEASALYAPAFSGPACPRTSK